MHVPTATKAAWVADTVQTEVDVEAKLTVRPEDAVAVTVNGVVSNGSFGSAPNVMVCLFGVT